MLLSTYGLLGLCLLLPQGVLSEQGNGWIRLPDHLQQKKRRINTPVSRPSSFIRQTGLNFPPEPLKFYPPSPLGPPPSNYNPYMNVPPPPPVLMDYENFAVPPNDFGARLPFSNFPPNMASSSFNEEGLMVAPPRGNPPTFNDNLMPSNVFNMGSSSFNNEGLMPSSPRGNPPTFNDNVFNMVSSSFNEEDMMPSPPRGNSPSFKDNLMPSNMFPGSSHPFFLPKRPEVFETSNLPSASEIRPCELAPFPPIREEIEFCRFVGFNVERFYYDPTVARCQKYDSCRGPSGSTELNVWRNSFDSYEECSLSCYMRGTCCGKDNTFSDNNGVRTPEVKRPSYFTCRNGALIPIEGRCNGVPQCQEGEDELSCFRREEMISPTAFNHSSLHRCPDGSFIAKDYLCDGIEHCPGGNDETNCPFKAIRDVTSLTFNTFDEMVFRRSETPFVVVYFFAPWCKACTRFRPVFKKVAKDYVLRDVTFYEANLEEEPLLGERFLVDTFPRILLWNLRLMGTPMEFYKDYGLNTIGFTLWLEESLKSKMRNNCGLREFPCSSYMECLPKSLVCDSFWQCRDGSDERLCQRTREANKSNNASAPTVSQGNEYVDAPNVVIRPSSTTWNRPGERNSTRWTTKSTRRTTPKGKWISTTSGSVRRTTKSNRKTPSLRTSTSRIPTITTSFLSTTTKKIVRVTPYIPRTTRRTTTPETLRTSPIPSTSSTTSSSSDVYEYYDHEKDVIDYGIIGSVLPIEPESEAESSSRKPCELQCRDGTCIRFSSRCNGVRECSDGEDEESCASCKRTQFTCKSNKECIDYMRRCDGDMDCEDGSDEVLCDKACKKTEFMCDDGTCINFAKRCNGVYNCADKSDEAYCPSQCNSTTEFTCNDGKCIDKVFLCDGRPHCHDSTDEISCEKSDNCDGENEWKCLTGFFCIDKRKRCDGYPDCQDLSDEDIEQCPKMECNDEWQFQCWDRMRCIDSRRLCDGYEDCLDRSDEIDCMNVVCQYWQFKCKDDGVCVDSRRKCDGYNDCKDGSDELNCEGLSTQIYVFEHSPETLKTSLFSDAILDCNVVNPSGKWTYEGQNVYQSTKAGREGRLGSSYSNGSLLIRNVQNEDVGYYTCASSEGNEVSSVYLILDTSSCTKECKEEEDSEPVCGSTGVKYSSLCELKKASCNQKIKIVVVDMSKCDRQSEDSKCAIDERECSLPEGKCIKETSFCDGIPDCEDGGDEKLCFRRDMKSVILGKNVSVAIQSGMMAKVVRIQCHLRGDAIIWWFNEKIIQSDSAHEVNPKDKELIINDVRKGDAGWYSCRNMDLEEYRVYLHVEYPASALGGPAGLSFLVGQRGVIPCRTDAHPPISYIVWHKNGSPIGSTNGSLVLSDVTSSKDRGDYTCTPYNSQGTSGPSTKVAVRVRTRFYECPLNCYTNVYDPVCGMDGVTYDNECLLIMESCNNIRLKDLYAVHSGSCEKQSLLPFGGIASSQSTTSNIMLEILGASTTMVPYIDPYEPTELSPLNIYSFPTTTNCPSSTPTPLTTTPIYVSWTTTRVPYEQKGSKSCKSQEWACDDGQCIPFLNQCNGVPDCVNGEDEKYCADLRNDFVCGDMFIDKSLVCDGYPHCLNGEDEDNCPILEEEEYTWTCPNSNEEHICDDYGKCVCASLAPSASLPPFFEPQGGFTTTPFPFLFLEEGDNSFFGSGDYQMDDA